MGLNKRLFTSKSGVVNTENFNIVTYTGTGAARSITGVGFKPDLYWIKKRSSDINSNHMWFDVIRGIDAQINSDTTDAEYDGGGTGYVTAVGSDGFSLTGNALVNQSGQTYVAWNWKAGGTAVSNTDGVTAGSVTAVTSQVSANVEAGFSICTFTTPSNGKPSWGHGLDSAPELIIIKNTASAVRWFVYAPSALGQKELVLNTTDDATSYSPNFISSDSTKIDLGSSSFNISGSAAHVAYCFHSVDGYQKVGKYQGTGNSGLEVTTGFQPRFLLIKSADANSTNWFIFDSVRGNGKGLLANSNGAEFDNSSAYGITLGSNSFTLNFGSGTTQLNTSGHDYLYLAIA